MTAGRERLVVLGLDPGLRRTGWGAIVASGSRLSYVAHGVIAPTATELPARLAELNARLREVVNHVMPHALAVEEVFVSRNAQSTLRLGMARGVVLSAAAETGLSVGEYAANTVKKTVVGAGHADKRQVSHMVQRLLPGCAQVEGDAADALAVAICHAHHRTWNLAVHSAEAKARTQASASEDDAAITADAEATLASAAVGDTSSGASQ